MIQNIINKRFNSLGISKDRLHLAEHLFALLEHFIISLPRSRHKVILFIDQANRLLIQFQLQNTALIINRACSPILDSLCHVINIDIVTKDRSGIAIL